MRVEQAVASAWANCIIKPLLARAVRQLQAMTGECLVSGNDSPLRNTWEEICAQVQEEEWLSWDVHMQTVDAILGGHLEELHRDELLALWLQTEEAWDWVYNHHADAHGYDTAPVCRDHVVRYLRRLLLEAAGDYSNKRIRAALERSF